jgi:Flp pilus assembly protein TadB
MELWQFWVLAGINAASVFLSTIALFMYSMWSNNRKKRKLLESMFEQVLEKVETDIQFRDIVGKLNKDGNDE